MIGLLGAGVAVLILFFMGAFSGGKVEPGRISPIRAAFHPERVVVAKRINATQWYEAVGTVRPFTETKIEARVASRVEQVFVRPGDKVKAGDLLVKLDSRELKSRLEQARKGMESAAAAREQARQSIDAAKATFANAASTYKRIKILFSEKAVAEQELDRAEAEYLQTKAALARSRNGLARTEALVEQARNAEEEARINLDYTSIRATEDAEVARRMVEPGDMAIPGKALLYLQTGESLRLEASVREGVIGRIKRGEKLPVLITVLGRRTEGTVDEIVPSGDPATRTFLVKVALPASPGLYPGMFGRLLIPLGEKPAVVVERDALRRVGQLTAVVVETDGAEGWRSVYVRTGEDAPFGSEGDMVEILAGLDGNETVAVGGVF
jgi:RND family efflux transporter MFP subunit